MSAATRSRWLRITDVTKGFGGHDVLRGVSLEVEPGAICALLGPSGSGKTTLLRLIAGLEVIDGGTIALGDQILADAATSVPPERRRIGMVFQDWALFPHLTVADNVAFGLGRKPDARRVNDALDMVGLRSEAHRRPGTLSGGQQQRVALARALAPEPEVLLLDEPFSNLDVTLRARLRREVHTVLRTAGVTTVFVTHDQDEAFVLGDRVAVMNSGVIEQVDPPPDLYQRPASAWVAGFVGDANLVPGSAAGDHAATALGPIELARSADGAVQVLVRPEQLALQPATNGDGTHAVITFVEYYGHDAMVSLRHPQLGPLRARVLSSTIEPGDHVDVSFVGGQTVSFPVHDAAAEAPGGAGVPNRADRSLRIR